MDDTAVLVQDIACPKWSVVCSTPIEPRFGDNPAEKSRPGNAAMALSGRSCATTGSSGTGWPPRRAHRSDSLSRVGPKIPPTCGWRQPRFGFSAAMFDDDGASRDVDRTILIREAVRNGNLGYPVTLDCRDGSLLTLYYGEDDDGVTCILATRREIGRTELLPDR